MKDSEKKEDKKRFFSLQKKIALMGIILVFLAILSFAAVGGGQLLHLSGVIKQESENQSQYSKMYSDVFSMMEINNSYKKIDKLSSDYLTKMLNQFELVLSIMADNTKVVFENPELYSRIRVSKSTENKNKDKDKKEKLTCHFMLPDREKTWRIKNDSAIMGLSGLMPILDCLLTEEGDMFLSATIAMKSGASLCFDKNTTDPVDDDGNPITFDPRKEAWYQNAIKGKDIVYTIKQDCDFDHQSEIILSAPVYGKDDKLICVTAVHISIDGIESILKDSVDCDKEQLILMDRDGGLIASTIASGKLSSADDLGGKIVEYADDVDSKEGLKETLKNSDDLTVFEMDGNAYFGYSAHITKPGWSEFLFVDEDKFSENITKMEDILDDIFEETEGNIHSAFQKHLIYLVILLVVLVIISIVLSIRVSKRITKPINRMTEKVRELTGDNIRFEMLPEYNTHDEIEVLAETFSNMSEKLQEQVEEIIDITAQNERMETELNVATRIQSGMLPKIFPLYPERTEFSLFASMDPAREVGGDFYDVFLRDEDHLVMVVADVSDKGVPAALFMVVAKTQIKTRALRGGSPSEILADVNELLCDGNNENQFVTVWLGILTISTGELVEANAGHEKPIRMHTGENFEILKTKHGLVMGGMPGVKYREDSMTLGSGDVIFMYTDGVTEATNKDKEQFGEKRLLESLNTNKELEPDELLPAVRRDIDAFVGEASQFDDLTMLAIKIE